MIFNGQLMPGDGLKELDLTERLGVSRSPVRDALKELERQGLVDVDEINGRRVLRALGERDIAETYDVRIELEALAARYAARDASEVAKRHLADRLEVLRSSLSEPTEAWLPLDFAFHAAVAAASERHQLPQLLSTLWIQIQAFLRRMDRVGAYPDDRQTRLAGLREHEALAAAILAGDPAGADAAVRAHLEGRRDALILRFHGTGMGSV
jgi:DNA-binding GntR family transcriptional regulator